MSEPLFEIPTNHYLIRRNKKGEIFLSVRRGDGTKQRFGPYKDGKSLRAVICELLGSVRVK